MAEIEFWEWVIEDDTACDECSANDGMYFPIYSELDPPHPNCRCTAVPVEPEEYQDTQAQETALEESKLSELQKNELAWIKETMMEGKPGMTFMDLNDQLVRWDRRPAFYGKPTTEFGKAVFGKQPATQFFAGEKAAVSLSIKRLEERGLILRLNKEMYPLKTSGGQTMYVMFTEKGNAVAEKILSNPIPELKNQRLEILNGMKDDPIFGAIAKILLKAEERK